MRKLNKSLQVESILKDLGPRATSCLAYHPQASKFAGCKSILFNLEEKEKSYSLQSWSGVLMIKIQRMLWKPDLSWTPWT